MVRDQAAESGPSPPRIVAGVGASRSSGSSGRVFGGPPGLVLLKLLQPGRANALMADKEVKTDPRNGR